MSFYIGRQTTVNTATNVVGGIASVTSLNVSGIGTVITLTSTNANVSGVITSTTYDIGTVGSQTSGILTTTNANANQVLDSSNNNIFQTARYQISIACTGQLVGSATSASTASVGSITAGAGYTAVSYTNVSLTGGGGNSARANIGVGVSYAYVGFTSATDLLVSNSTHRLAIGVGTIAVSFASNIPNSTFTGFAVTAGNIYYAVGVGSTVFRIYSNSAGTDQITGIGNTTFSGVGNTMTISGGVNSVQIVSPGSNYSVGNVLSATLGDLGSGFSFPVTSVVKNYQVSDFMILQSVGSASTTCDFVEYATIANDDILATISADISGSNSRVLISPTYTHNTIKYVKNSIVI